MSLGTTPDFFEHLKYSFYGRMADGLTINSNAAVLLNVSLVLMYYRHLIENNPNQDSRSSHMDELRKFEQKAQAMTARHDVLKQHKAGIIQKIAKKAFRWNLEVFQDAVTLRVCAVLAEEMCRKEAASISMKIDKGIQQIEELLRENAGIRVAPEGPA